MCWAALVIGLSRGAQVLLSPCFADARGGQEQSECSWWVALPVGFGWGQVKWMCCWAVPVIMSTSQLLANQLQEEDESWVAGVRETSVLCTVGASLLVPALITTSGLSPLTAPTIPGRHSTCGYCTRGWTGRVPCKVGCGHSER